MYQLCACNLHLHMSCQKKLKALQCSVCKSDFRNVKVDDARRCRRDVGTLLAALIGGILLCIGMACFLVDRAFCCSDTSAAYVAAMLLFMSLTLSAVVFLVQRNGVCERVERWVYGAPTSPPASAPGPAPDSSLGIETVVAR